MTRTTVTPAPGVTISITGTTRHEEILNPRSVEIIAELERQFRAQRLHLLQERASRQAKFDRGELPGFLEETKAVRDSPWTAPPPPVGLTERLVEITGPPERKMTINALNSGANVWLADFEDANVPRWPIMLDGQVNILDAIRKTIAYESPDGRIYRISGQTPTIVARPRGWHLQERAVLIDDKPASASLVDFGLYLTNGGIEALNTGTGIYFYIPKLENHAEARLWNDVFSLGEKLMNLPKGTIRATVLIETVTAAFEMDEILFELGVHAAGLNAGRWDYLFSIIKKFRNLGERYVLPDRNSVTMTAPFMREYTDLLVTTCHRRGVHAIGGMAAYIPNRRSPDLTAVALEKVREDKEREARQGFDGSWVAHPDLVPLCRESFVAVLGSKPNQLNARREGQTVTTEALLDVRIPDGAVTEAGLRNNISVVIQYLAAWLNGNGAVAIFNLMEDMATAEIARSQLWQWLHHAVSLDSGRKVSPELIEELINEELDNLKSERRQLTTDGKASTQTDTLRLLERAGALIRTITLGDEFPEFLTCAAEQELDGMNNGAL